MVEIEENSTKMIMIHNEKLIKKILSEKFKLMNYRRISIYSAKWKMDIYKKIFGIPYKYIGFVYTAEDRHFTSIIIGGDPVLFKETAEKLEENGIEVTIQKPIK